MAALRADGYVVGQNVVVDFRSALGRRAGRFPPLAVELVRAGVDIIVTSTEVGAAAARDATRTIPIVMMGERSMHANLDPAPGLVLHRDPVRQCGRSRCEVRPMEAHR